MNWRREPPSISPRTFSVKPYLRQSASSVPQELSEVMPRMYPCGDRLSDALEHDPQVILGLRVTEQMGGQREVERAESLGMARAS